MRILSYVEAEPTASPSAWLDEPMYEDWLLTEPIPLFRHIVVAFEKAKYLLELSDNWDEAGGSPVSPETWKRALEFVVIHAALVWARHAAIIPPFRVLPGPDGSIDLHWKTTTRELLINIPSDSDMPATFYGDNFGAGQQRGSIKLGDLNVSIFAWLTITD